MAGQDQDATLLREMSTALKHRGPDGHGEIFRQGLAIGNQRLAIIDIQGGKQPFVSDDGEIAVVQNGEIFNYLELAMDLARDGYLCRTRSDTEVLLRLYEREGIGFLDKLNGMFAFAIADFRKQCIYLARDRVGVKPLYWCRSGDTIWFASEIKSLLGAGVSAELDESALDLYLTYNFVPPPVTMFRQIRHLPPGHVAICSRPGVTINRWWHPYEVETVPIGDEAGWAEEFNATLEDAVRLRLRSDVQVGAFLSGGVDSSSIVAYMSKLSAYQVQTFSIGFEDARFDESPYARAASARFQTKHICEEVREDVAQLWPRVTYYCDQPHGDVSFLPTYRVASLAAKHAKVVLTGDGGDELFGGYEKYASFFSAPDLSSEYEFERSYLDHISLFDRDAKERLYSPALALSVRDHNTSEIANKIFQESRHFDRINRALYLDLLMLLPGNNLVKPDRMGMAVSLEARTPFLDRRMIEFALRTPGDRKVRNGETKHEMKKAVTQLIGQDLAYRDKRMFTLPIGEWFKQELRNFCYSVLLSDRAASRGLFNMGYVQQMIDQHVGGYANRTRELRALLALELWFNMFIDTKQVMKTSEFGWVRSQ